MCGITMEANIRNIIIIIAETVKRQVVLFQPIAGNPAHVAIGDSDVLKTKQEVMHFWILFNFLTKPRVKRVLLQSLIH